MSTVTTASPVARELALQMLEAWNTRRLDDLLLLMTEDVEWYDPAMADPPLRGHAAIRQFSADVLRAFPDFTYEIDGPICTSDDGLRCAIRWRITATNTGELRPLGYAPTGRRVTMEGVDVLDARGGRIARILTAFDPIPGAEQLLNRRLRPTPGTWRAVLAVRMQRMLAWIARRGNAGAGTA